MQIHTQKIALIIAACLSSSVFAGEDLSSSYWSLGWSNKATVISKESKSTYIRLIPSDKGMRLAYIVSGEGACPGGESTFEASGVVNGKKLSFSGKCTDKYYKELIPATEEGGGVLKDEFMTKPSVAVKIGTLPKRTFTTSRFESVFVAAGGV